MKTKLVHSLSLLTIVLVAGCHTPARFPNANLNTYEARGRAAIAAMPVRTWWSDRALPEDHPWHAPIKAQNLRIAHAPANFDVVFDIHEGQTTLTLSFDDPSGVWPPRYVDFDFSTGEILDCTMPICSKVFGATFVTDGILPPVSERPDPTVSVGMPYCDAHAALLGWGAVTRAYGVFGNEAQGFELPDRHTLFVFTTEDEIDKLSISQSPRTNDWAFQETTSVDLSKHGNAEQSVPQL